MTLQRWNGGPVHNEAVSATKLRRVTPRGDPNTLCGASLNQLDDYPLQPREGSAQSGSARPTPDKQQWWVSFVLQVQLDMLPLVYR